MKKSKIFGAIAAAAMAVSAFAAFPVSAGDTYHAYIGVQESTTWRFRNAWNDPTYGKDSGYFDELHMNGTEAVGGSFEDAEITGDGTYSVKGNFDWSDVETFSLLFVSTDIPLDAGISISDVNIIIDGNNKYTFDEAFLSPDDTEYMNVLAINQWNTDIADLFAYTMPSESVEIQFTVSGMGSAAAASDDTAAETTAPAADSNTASATTGNVPVAAMVSVTAVAGIAAIASRKRK